MTTVSADRTTLTLTSLGRDQATALRAGDLGEISDDASELGPNRGHLTALTVRGWNGGIAGQGHAQDFSQ